MPYIGVTYPGADATNNFNNYTQLTVPASITTQRHAAWQFTAKELTRCVAGTADQRLC
jgi:hypothetical protein